jgi:hypothetical protein
LRILRQPGNTRRVHRHCRAGSANRHSCHGDPFCSDHRGRQPQAENAAAPAGEDPPHRPHCSCGASRPVPPLSLVPRRLAVRSPKIQCRDRRQVSVLGRLRRLPRQALRLLRGPRAPSPASAASLRRHSSSAGNYGPIAYCSLMMVQKDK